MNNTILRLLPTLLAGLVTLQIHGQTAADSPPPRLLIKWRDGPASAAAVEGNARIGAAVKRNFLALGWQLVALPPGVSEGDGLRAYQKLASVAAVEPDGRVALEPPRAPSTSPQPVDIRPLSLTPNDPRYNSQWYLRKISAPDAWDTTTGDSNIVVAILDTGVDYNHPDLAPNMWRNPGETGLDDQGRDKATNGTDDDQNGYVDDVHGVNVKDNTGDPMDFGTWSPPDSTASDPVFHGTFIAGLIAARGNNGLGVAGLNWTVQLMAIKFNGGDASDPGFNERFISGPLAGFDYLLMMKQRGVNLRVVSHSYLAARESMALREAVVTAGEAGILSVYAAGNSSSDRDLQYGFPGAFTPAVITVAASTSSDTLADFSNFGRSTVDLAAPGENVFSTWKGSSYRSGDGTSYAGPLVAGAAALLLSVNPDLTVDELKAAIYGSVDQPASMRGRLVTNGRLNVARALQYLTNASLPALVINTAPAGRRTLPQAPVQVTFNRAMDHASVEGNFRIVPALSGAFEWSEDSRSMTFRPDAPSDTATNYTVRILGAAQDATGGTLDGDFDRVREGSPADDFLWTFRFPLANDDFVNARGITNATGTIQSSNRDASPEMTEPIIGDGRFYTSSLWYRWSPSEPGGWFTFDLTSGTSFDSLLGAYTGESLDQLILVASNDNYGGRTSSRISFAAIPGTTYSVVVAGKADSGAFKLIWYPTPTPGFTGAGFSPASGTPGARITLTGTNFTGATAVLFNGTDAGFTNGPANYLDLRLTAVVPPEATSGPITILTPHGDVTSANSFQVLPPPLSVALSSVGGLELTWPATSRALELESTDNLSPALWSPVTVPFTRTNGATRVMIPAGPKGRYFRLTAP